MTNNKPGLFFVDTSQYNNFISLQTIKIMDEELKNNEELKDQNPDLGETAEEVSKDQLQDAVEQAERDAELDSENPIKEVSATEEAGDEVSETPVGEETMRLEEPESEPEIFRDVREEVSYSSDGIIWVDVPGSGQTLKRTRLVNNKTGVATEWEQEALDKE